MKTYLGIPALHATASHLSLIQAKLDTLDRAKRDSWAQLLTSASRLFAAGELSYADLAVLCAEMKDSYGPGYSTAWNSIMPVAANQVKWLAERELQAALIGTHGCWRGLVPVADQMAPPKGTSVLYVLFDDENEPVYVGSTGNFRARMYGHQRDKREAVRWVAYPCHDRDRAYEIEDRVLKERLPRMNKRAGR
jgi:predicted GIY-YIG superfamily endonuclease